MTVLGPFTNVPTGSTYYMQSTGTKGDLILGPLSASGLKGYNVLYPVSTNLTMTGSYNYYSIATLVGTGTISIPTGMPAGTQYTIADVLGTVNTPTTTMLISAPTGNTINGTTGYLLKSPYESVQLINVATSTWMLNNVSAYNYDVLDISNILGCALWLRADNGLTITSAGVVSSWSDYSGQNVTFSQPTAALQPSVQTGVISPPNSYLPTVSFSNGASNYMQGASGTLTTLTGDMFFQTVVQNASFVATFNTLFSKGTTSEFDCYAQTGSITVVRGGSAGIFTATIPISTQNNYIITFNQIGGVASIYVNGSLIATTTFGAQLATSNAPRIGRRADGGTQMTGYQAEVILYNRGLNPVELQRLYLYHWRKYFNNLG